MSAGADVRPALLGHLTDLHLPTVRECYEDAARRAERETLSYEQYLLEVMGRECEQRRFQAMDDDELLRTGKAAAFLCAPEANHGKPPREEFVLKLREARAEWKERARIRGSLSIAPPVAIDPGAS